MCINVCLRMEGNAFSMLFVRFGKMMEMTQSLALLYTGLQSEDSADLVQRSTNGFIGTDGMF